VATSTGKQDELFSHEPSSLSLSVLDILVFSIKS